VRRLRSRLMAGTVVRIIQDDPQLVEVAWIVSPRHLISWPCLAQLEAAGRRHPAFADDRPASQRRVAVEREWHRRFIS
jgi:hypothetical protein